MTRQRESEGTGWLIGAVVGGAALLGGVAWTLATWPHAPQLSHRLPSDDWQVEPNFTEADVEAAARMLASENPRGSRALHIEQIHTQLRARRAKESLYDRITAGSGWGPQGERSAPGGARPVATTEPATDELRKLAREVLTGVHPSSLPGARRFFHPAQQDRAFAVAERARNKQANGQALTADEKRLLRYRRNAEGVRHKWLSEGAKYVGVLDGVEFYG